MKPYIQDRKEGVIANVYTKSEYRRKGLASKLLNYAKRHIFDHISHTNHLTVLGKIFAKKNPLN